MELVWSRRATKGIMDLAPKARKAMAERLRAIAAEPFAPHANVDTIKGRKDAFRLRQSDWRAVYTIDRKAGVMHVIEIAKRGEVYR